MKRLLIGTRCREGHLLTAKTLKIAAGKPGRGYVERRSCRICNADRARYRRVRTNSTPAEITASTMPLDYWETWV